MNALKREIEQLKASGRSITNDQRQANRDYYHAISDASLLDHIADLNRSAQTATTTAQVENTRVTMLDLMIEIARRGLKVTNPYIFS